MGKRQEILINLLKTQSSKVNCAVISKPTVIDFKKSKCYNELLKIYRSLGGGQPEIPFNIGAYDCTIDGTIVELDEENHFNRYRLLTLQSDNYSSNSILVKDNYLSFCKAYESKCQARGGYWSSPSSEKQFGKSDEPGQFIKGGSSRWKQRAFYDLLKDHIPQLLGVPVKRISIYDSIDINESKISIDNVLKKGEKQYAPFIYKRIIG